MSDRGRQTNRGGSAHRRAPRQPARKRIELPSPEVTREPNGHHIRISTKTLSYPMTFELYTYGFKPQLLEAERKGFHTPCAPESFSDKAFQLRQLGSLLQSRTEVMKTIPGVKDHEAFKDAFQHMDHKLESLSAELGQMRSVTDHVFTRGDNIPFSGDKFAFEELQRKAEQERSATSAPSWEQAQVTSIW
ncbi:MAG: hypothetical protein Q9168_003479 [Polycauliona sp. 1 TL-2023]